MLVTECLCYSILHIACEKLACNMCKGVFNGGLNSTAQVRFGYMRH